MGFSSGKSRARRKAEQAQHDAYLKALKGMERQQAVGNQPTNNFRTISKQYGDNLDGYSAALLRKGDKMAREFNEKSGDINPAIAAYNERYDKVQRQLNGETIHDGYDVKVNDPNKAMGGLMGMAGSRYTKSFETLDDANNYTPQKSQAPVYGMGGAAGARPTTSQPNYIGFGQTAKEKPVTTEVVDRMQTGITDHRSSLRASSDAYNDMAKLADNANKAIDNSGLGSFQGEYDKLASRLRNSLKRSQGLVSPQMNGLMAKPTEEQKKQINAVL